MDRKLFLQNSAILAGATILPTASAFSPNLEINVMDKLTDANCNFIQQSLPYAENFLEPYMDAETLHLHYTFHHGGAMKGANKDMENIRKAMDSNSFETVDYYTKKLAYHFSSHVMHSIFWTNLTNKKTAPAGKLLKDIEKDLGS